MQHLDEGIIHTWLDGELSPEEAAAVEAHVAECAQCAATAAEARGFIAGSSRILTALDDAPRNVIPIRPVVRRRLGPAWRAAAAVLLVALGTVAIRNTLRVDRSTAKETPASDSVTITSSAREESVAPSIGNPGGTAAASVGNPGGTAAADQFRPTVLSQPAAPSKAATTKPMATVPVRAPAPEGMVAQAQRSDVSKARTFDKSAEAPVSAPSADLATSEGSGYSTSEELLKIVRVDSTSLERRTVFEVAPNETVTLVERAVSPVGEAGKVTVTGTTTAAAGLSAPVGGDSRRVMSTPAAKANIAAAPSQVTSGFVNTEQTIEWKDPTTGRVLRLTGRFPAERLQEIRKRIERQRAGQKKP
ncbi:MAG TPA: zf-HC2 domain-containing protein [Gemmatimonadaceae bacterium]